MQIEHLPLYAVVFAVVFGGFIISSFVVNLSDVSTRASSMRNWPPLFRLSRKILFFFVLIMGDGLKKNQKKRTEKLRKQLLAADIDMAPEYVYVAEIFWGLLLFALPLVFLLKTDKIGGVLFFSIITGLAGFIYPSVIISSSASKRQNVIRRSLPFALDLLCASIRAGLDFNAAVREYVLSEDAKNPLVVEFNIMLKELLTGQSRIQALQSVAGRIQLEEFDTFCGAIAHSTEKGAPMVETLRIQSEELRRARFNFAERKAARAPSLMIFPIAIFIMPSVFLVIGVPVYLKLQASGLGGLM